MERRTLLASGLVLLTAGQAFAQQPAPGSAAPAQPAAPGQPAMPANGGSTETYSHDEILDRVSDFMGVTAETAGAIIERAFKDNGRPTAYIAGQEGSAAFIFGLRYGKGLIYMKDKPTQPVYWQGPSVGFDAGGNASRVFVLCYDLQYADAIYRRFPGVEGSAYFIGGMGINYQRADGITIAPIRAGVGLRLGADVGYLAYTRHQNLIPL